MIFMIVTTDVNVSYRNYPYYEWLLTETHCTQYTRAQLFNYQNMLNISYVLLKLHKHIK